MPQDFWSNALFSVTPTILVGLIFWFALRAIIRADRTERKAYAKIEAEERALGLGASRQRFRDASAEGACDRGFPPGEGRRYPRGLSRTFGSSGAGSARPS